MALHIELGNYGFSVSTERAYTIKRIDGDYFESGL